MILGINHASFLTGDLVKARQFYEGVLGLNIDSNRPKMSFEGVWYKITPSQQIHLIMLPNHEEKTPRSKYGGRDRHVALTVADITKLIENLKAANVVFTLSSSGRRAVFCHDPDGNALEFIEGNR